MTSLGNLVRVDPRTVWKHEAHDFTPWLVENIDRLSQVLGLELEPKYPVHRWTHGTTAAA